MSFLIYQRSDPRYGEWIPLLTQQIRLRNLIQIVGVNFFSDRDRHAEDSMKDEMYYYTLHLAPISAPFFTSEKIPWSPAMSWKEVEPRDIPEYVPLSAPGVILRVWSTYNDCKAVVSWGVIFVGLHYIGKKLDLKPECFSMNTVIFRTPIGYYTDIKCLVRDKTLKLERYFTFQNTKCLDVPKSSYTVKSLASLHAVQRAVLEEVAFARSLKQEISQYGYTIEIDASADTSRLLEKSLQSPTVPNQSAFYSSAKFRSGQTSSRHLNIDEERMKIQLREAIENKKNLVKLLKDEKGRWEGRVHRIKQRIGGLDERVIDLTHRVHALGRERERLKEFKGLLYDKKTKLADARSLFNLRKKQLISELLVIYPIKLVEGSKKYSIAEVQLPNAEDYGNENSAQVSCALGYTAHLIAVMCFFLGIPSRYPIRHFGSKSRIVDHITTQIPDKEREFPLYFRGREDVYSKYAVWLLNKNVAQLRWYCGLSTQDLRATLPNLYNLLTSRLIIPGWPPSPDDSCELAEELTEESQQHFFKNDVSRSLDGGLDQISHKDMVIKSEPVLRSSFSDLEFAGGSAVPQAELYHGREQNRFLSGWKKRTYSEAEEIDPCWLTDSLSLDLDLGRVSNTPSPPLKLPALPNDYKELVRRKRRFGRIELPTMHQSPSTSPVKAPIASVLPSISLPENPQLLTPNHSMNEVEQHIKETERRKSVCDTNRASPQPPASHLASKRSSFLSPNVPTVDHYSTTDEEKFDDTIAEVVRKISQLDIGRQTPKISDSLTGSPREIAEEKSIPTLIIDSSACGDIGDGNGNGCEESPNSVCAETDQNSLAEYRYESKTVVSGAMHITSSKDSLLQDNNIHVQTTGNSHLTLENEPTATTNIPSTDSSCDNSVDETSRNTGNELTPSAVLTSATDDSSSLWLRTEALMGSQHSFNLVRRRISESN